LPGGDVRFAGVSRARFAWAGAAAIALLAEENPFPTWRMLVNQFVKFANHLGPRYLTLERPRGL